MLRMQGAIRVDEGDARGHDFHLGLAKFPGHGVKLAVDVADADIVEVHERERANAAAGERFDRPRADTADADHTDM